jgi:hypothetical protein
MPKTFAPLRRRDPRRVYQWSAIRRVAGIVAGSISVAAARAAGNEPRPATRRRKAVRKAPDGHRESVRETAGRGA